VSEIRHKISSVAAIKRRGVYDAGHFDQYLIEKIQILTKKLFGVCSYPLWPSTLEWSDNDEGFGFSPLPETTENFGIATGNIPKEFISLPQDANLSKELQYIARKMNIAIPPLQFHTKEEYLLYNKCRLEGLCDSDIVVEFAKKSDGRTIFPKLFETVKNFAKKHEDFIDTSAVLYSNNLCIDFINSLEDEDEFEETDQSDEEMQEIADPNPMEPMEEGSTAVQTAAGIDSVETVPEDFSEFPVVNDPVLVEQVVPVPRDCPIASLIIPSQLFSSGNDSSETERNPKRCQTDKRNAEQKAAHKGAKFICGKTKCKGMRGSALCETPVVDYVRKSSLRSKPYLGDNRPVSSKKVKRCKAQDPANPNNICMSATCPGRGNRSLCTSFNVK
jgi:hypothetical protein